MFWGEVPPSGGSLDIGNKLKLRDVLLGYDTGSPFGGIPRNWKLLQKSIETTSIHLSSPFGGIPRNWKRINRNYFARRALRFPLRGDP